MKNPMFSRSPRTTGIGIVIPPILFLAGALVFAHHFAHRFALPNSDITGEARQVSRDPINPEAFGVVNAPAADPVERVAQPASLKR